MKSKHLFQLSSLAACIVLTLLPQSSCFAQDYISDSTTSWYRYEVEQYTKAILTEDMSFEDIDLRERDLLKPTYSHFKMAEGVNSQNQSFTQIHNVELASVEDWISAPDIQLITPSGSYGLDSTGELIYQSAFTAGELSAYQEEVTTISSQGFFPVMLFFPNIHDQWVEEAMNEGGMLMELGDGSFKLSWPEDELLIDPSAKQITRTYSTSEEHIKETTSYGLYAPYGYVPVLSIEERQRNDLPSPVVFVTTSFYFNHSVEDLNGIIRKYTDEAFIEVYPNPVEGEYEVVLRGIPAEGISQVVIRDFMGNVAHTHLSPQVQHDMLTLDASSYPSGPLILQVYTSSGVYTETITKP